MTQKIMLYGTEGCHLCNDVETILTNHNIAYNYCDIANNDALVEEYGWFIPVIQYNDSIWKSPLNMDEILKVLQQ